MRISKITIGIGSFIIISASFMRQGMEFIQAQLGERGFIVFMAVLLVVPALAFLISLIRNRRGVIKITVIMAILIIGLALTWQIKLPQERIHLLEYVVLGWFAARDFIRTAGKKKIKAVVLACLVSFIAGVLDEGFQAILPYRVFDLRDIGFNSLGGIWGVILYMLK